MDAHTDKAQANIDIQMQQWSMQRARLEEEIIRRQEASRFAAPSMSSEAKPSSGTKHTADRGYLSPYQYVGSDQVRSQLENNSI